MELNADTLTALFFIFTGPATMAGVTIGLHIADRDSKKEAS